MYGADEYSANFQEYLQFKKIFSHKLEVMNIFPPFNDRIWFEENYSSVKLYRFNMQCEKNTEHLLKVWSNPVVIYFCSISEEMYRVMKGYKSILFIEYNGSIIDMLPCPEPEDVEEFNKYNYNKNQTSEQMRYLRILFSQIEEDIDPDWAQYSGDTENLLTNIYEYQNRKYEFASDSSVSLINNEDIDAFILEKAAEIESGIMISFTSKYKRHLFKTYIELKNPDIKDVEYRFPVTKTFREVFRGADSFVFCIVDFEVKEIIPMYS